MIHVLRHPVFARLFAAQVVALLGTGLLSVGLGLMAYDLAQDRAGLVLGAVFTIKMIAYVGLSPIAQALVHDLPRRAVLIGADLVRGGVALCLPFVTEIWQIYVLIFVLQAASATFTPAFQATIPDVLADEEDYTHALSLSRMAYDLENLTSPALAGLLLMVLSYNWLFLGTVLGFAVSAGLVLSVALPRPGQSRARPFRERLTRGARIYLATPRLRGLWALTLSAAAISAFVLVNTVVLVRVTYGGSESDLAVALAAYGAGSMAAAFMLPRLLGMSRDRSVMMAGATGLVALAGLTGMLLSLGGVSWRVMLLIWLMLGFFYSVTLTPSGRLLRRSATQSDRPAVFAAQFALSHLCWLVTYPLAGWAGHRFGLGPAFLILGCLALVGLLLALKFWPRDMGVAPSQGQPQTPGPQTTGHAQDGHRHHSHEYVIDDRHRRGPEQDQTRAD